MIEVGEYIRDKEGNIDKIINTLSLFKDVYLYLGKEGYQYSENTISKHSPNLIELIEEGDCVNGYKVIFIDGDEVHIDASEKYGSIPIKENEIKTIVTHEQFKSIEYRVETEEKK